MHPTAAKVTTFPGASSLEGGLSVGKSSQVCGKLLFSKLVKVLKAPKSCINTETASLVFKTFSFSETSGQNILLFSFGFAHTTRIKSLK